MSVSAPPLAGLTVRPYRPGDAAAITELVTRSDVADEVPWRVSVDEIESWLSRRNQHFDPTRDMRMVELDGRPVAYWQVDWVDTTDGLREYRISCVVDPDSRGRGIGAWMLAEAEAYSRGRARALPSDRPHFYGNWQPDTARASIRLVERHGYEPVRYFFDMVRPTLDGIVEFPLPEGLEQRPIADDQVLQLWTADVEAFQDHWGGFDGSPERLEEWRRDPKIRSRNVSTSSPDRSWSFARNISTSNEQITFPKSKMTPRITRRPSSTGSRLLLQETLLFLPHFFRTVLRVGVPHGDVRIQGGTREILVLPDPERQVVLPPVRVDADR